jgi:catechol 2,3-dioxygenase-like lactoylglutathione lyase family enzyme
VPQTIGYVALLVRDYDEAISFFTRALSFAVIEILFLATASATKSAAYSSVLRDLTEPICCLAKASTPEELRCIGNQTGGRLFLFLHTDDFWRDYQAMSAKGVKFTREPSEEPYGTVAVFEDLYGNLWDLLELKGGK